jgi:hypothetical protein
MVRSTAKRKLTVDLRYFPVWTGILMIVSLAGNTERGVVFVLAGVRFPSPTPTILPNRNCLGDFP